MANKACPECGYPLQGNEKACPECGSPINLHKPIPISTVIIDEGDNEAENILRKWLKWIRILIIVISVIIGLFIFVGGFVAASFGTGWEAVAGIITGPLVISLGYALAWLIWSVGMIFINISTNVRTIKRELLSK